ncbi:hypothetical protein [Snuella sedimenti]|uniref:Cytochrome c domain-containing protein n=1 Tax=Snuella sedimenti TaxID=2798802 RepID=A0A8J7LM53_9FLAO|nr:hypothetical protein [Snuella sedimenti]MBJ6367089.1 hypothetical protein [Snuella sedimenti]
MKHIPTIACLLLIMFYSCTNASEDDLTDSTSTPSTVTYNDHVKPIIDNNCISCHKVPAVNGASVSLLTYTNVKNAIQNNNLISKINGNGPGGLMPLGGPKLPQNLIDIITKWETDGLLEN